MKIKRKINFKYYYEKQKNQRKLKTCKSLDCIRNAFVNFKMISGFLLFEIASKFRLYNKG